MKGHVSEVLNRHHLRDRTQLVVPAYESGLVRPGGGPGRLRYVDLCWPGPATPPLETPR